MSDIIDFKDLQRLKELKDKYLKERQSIQIQIDQLQSQLEILDY